MSNHIWKAISAIRNLVNARSNALNDLDTFEAMDATCPIDKLDKLSADNLWTKQAEDRLKHPVKWINRRFRVNIGGGTNE